MSMTNDIERRIIDELKKQEGGAFQKIFNDYLFRDLYPESFNTLGSELATNKTTKGVPDSFFYLPNGKYVLINYGTVKDSQFSKLKKDVRDSLDSRKTGIPRSKIDTIICGTAASNIKPGQEEELHQLVGKKIKLKIITVEQLAKELCFKYPLIAKDHLGINVDTLQILSISDFVEAYDRTAIAAPLDTKFMFRDTERAELIQDIKGHKAVIVAGSSGVGKTRLVLQVCKQFEDQGYKVRCIKNNGESLKDDWQTHMADLGKSLIFIDDANETSDLEYVFNQIVAREDMKLVLTVRDYLKADVAEKVRSVCDANAPEIAIKPMPDTQIEEILKDSLGIVNKKYLDKIASAAKGNVRLALLAGKTSKEKDFAVLWDETDIYQTYFDPIFRNLKLDESDLKLMFLASFLDTLRLESDLDRTLLKKLNVTDPEGRARSLCKQELVDFSHDKLVRVSDQSLSDYVLYKVLFGDSLVKLEDLFAWCLPQARIQLVRSINTILSLFNTDKTKERIASVIKQSWKELEDKDRLQFVASFGPVIPDYTLSYLYQEISKMPAEGSNINGKLVIDSLINFKNDSVRFKTATDLLCKYLDKCPGQLAEAIQELKPIFFSDYSFANNYFIEHGLIKSLESKINEGSIVAKRLFLEVAPTILNFRISNSQMKDNRTLLIKTGNLLMDKPLLELRAKVWQMLGELYKDPNFDGRERILGIVKSQHYSQAVSKDEEARRWFIQADLKIIQDCILDNPVTSSELIALNYLNKQAIKNGLNPILSVDELLIIKLATLKQSQLTSKKFVDKFGPREIIVALSELLNEPDVQKRRVSYSAVLQLIFSEHLDDEICATYFNLGMPFYSRATGLANKLVSRMPIEEIHVYLEQSDNLDFVSDLYQELILAHKDTKLVSEYQKFLKKNWNRLTIAAWSFEAFKLCCSLKPDFLNTIYSKLLVHPQQIASLFDVWTDSGEILEMFAGNLDKLRELYLAAERNRFQTKNTDFFDEDLTLFWKLYDDDRIFLCNILSVVKEEAEKRYYSIPESVREGVEKIFDSLWQSKDYDRIIFGCFKLLRDDSHFYQVLSVIFERRNSSLNKIKTAWLMRKSLEHLNDELVRPLSYMVAEYYPEFMPEYIAKLVEQDSDFDLSRIYVASILTSWEGSMVPAIQGKIEQLNKVRKMLPTDCFEQRAYIQELIDGYEEEAKREEEFDFQEGMRE